MTYTLAELAGGERASDPPHIVKVADVAPGGASLEVVLVNDTCVQLDIKSGTQTSCAVVTARSRTHFQLHGLDKGVS
jgi:hypothetical protein